MSSGVQHSFHRNQWTLCGLTLDRQMKPLCWCRKTQNLLTTRKKLQIVRFPLTFKQRTEKCMKTKIFNALPFFSFTGSIYWRTGILQLEIFNPKIRITGRLCFVLFSIRRKRATQTRFLLILAWKLTIFTLINNVSLYSIDRIKCEWINKSNFLFGGE